MEERLRKAEKICTQHFDDKYGSHLSSDVSSVAFQLYLEEFLDELKYLLEKYLKPSPDKGDK